MSGDEQATEHLPDHASLRPRVHHYMNADGTCHAGELMEHGTPYVTLFAAAEVVRILNLEKAHAWDQGMRTGTSRAMRMMSDEPSLPLAGPQDNPYLSASPDQHTPDPNTCDICDEPTRPGSAICTACAEDVRDDHGADVGWGS